MADKEARVRLTLNSGSFLSGMQALSTDVQRVSRTMETAMQTPFSGGLKAAKDSFGKIRGELATISKMALGLGGAFELGSSIKGALEMAGHYKNLSFQIEAATGKLVKSAEIQERVESVANKWSRANKEVADSYSDLFVHTGNIEFAAKATDAVAVAAQAAQQPMAIFANVAAQLNKTLGITAEEMPTALAAMTSLAGKGADLSELSAVLMRTGASAKVMGLEGTSGLGKLAGMFEVMVKGGVARKQATTGLNEMMGDLTDPEKMRHLQEEIQKKFHKTARLTNKRGGIVDDAMFRILDATGGDSQKLKGLFPSVGGGAFMSEVGKHYQEELGKGGGKSAAREATQKWIEGLGESSLTASRQVQQAEENNKKAGSDMQKALNELENEFSKPEMIDALKQLAHLMPKVAHGAAQLVEMVANHPLLGGAAILGGKIGLDLAGAGMSSLGSALGRKIAAEVMAQKIVTKVVPIIDGLGMKIGQEFVQVAAASTPWTNAGKLLSVAAGAGIAAYLAIHYGMKAIDKYNEGKADIQRQSAVGVAISGTKDRSQIEPALAKARAALVRARADADFKPAVGGVFMMPTGGHQETPETRAAQNAVNELEEALRNLTRSSKEASGQLDRVKQSAGAASNGLPKPGSNEPGSEQ